ncbi:MAG: hypothetical protein OIF34_06495, partial [Porticoccaceae bacterium]|nr:hypothetical protein [Porticoccaceae bacterium]
ENIDEAEILRELDGLLGHFARERQPAEPFGDFLIRAGVVAENTEPAAFHTEMKRIDAVEVA